MIAAVGVVIPVNNEEASLPACISGIRAAVLRAHQHYPEVPVVVCFALDRCDDNSAAIIEAAGFPYVRSNGVGVGAARAAGVTGALDQLGARANHTIWLANTDADSVVPSDWLIRQIYLANQGADVIVGAVHPNEAELDEERRHAWQLTHLDGQAHGHVHGANLGIRANVYHAVGGFAPLMEHEDVDLVTRAAASRAEVRGTAENDVITSGRLEGRTDGGYAGYLRDELIPLAESSPSEQSVA
jgi:glycosyltransferase involved in cell wall biosynthesis